MRADGQQDGKLYLAPVGDDPKKIIDIGTGTGIWAVESASSRACEAVVHMC